MSTLKRHNSEPRLLIIQFARFGDLMQAAPLINALARQENAASIDLLVNDELVCLAERIIGVRKVWSFQREEWLDLCRRREASIVDWANTIVRNTCEIRQQEYDKVINLSHTFESAYIASMMNCQNIVGLVGERDQVNQVGEWERYFHFVLRNRSENGFNLVDIHKKQLGIEKTFLAPWLKLDENKIAEIAAKFHLKSESQRKMVAIQLGANHWVRRWGVENWVRVAEKISHDSSVIFYLVGSNKEITLAQDFQRQYSGKVVNLIGKTNLVELGSVIGRCHLVLGGDTGTMHLAAALGIPTLSIFLGMARQEDTAPYGSGRMIFSPERYCYPCAEQSSCTHLKCHQDISIGAVADAGLCLLENIPVEAKQEQTFKISVTYFDEDGCQRLKNTEGIDPQMQEKAVLRVLSNASAFTIGMVEQ